MGKEKKGVSKVGLAGEAKRRTWSKYRLLPGELGTPRKREKKKKKRKQELKEGILGGATGGKGKRFR